MATLQPVPTPTTTRKSSGVNGSGFKPPHAFVAACYARTNHTADTMSGAILNLVA